MLLRKLVPRRDFVSEWPTASGDRPVVTNALRRAQYR